MKFLAKISRRWVVAVLMIASGITALTGRGLSGWLRQRVSPALAPLGDGGMYLATSFKRLVRESTASGMSGAEAEALRDRYQELRGQLLTVSKELAGLVREREEMDRLYGRLRNKAFACKLLPARVVGAESLPYGNSRVLNAGRSRGVEPGAVVTTRRLLTDRSKTLLIPPDLAALMVPPDLVALSKEVFVGKVTAAGPFTARLQLVTDAGFRLRASICRTIDPKQPRQITVEKGARRAVQTLTRDNNDSIPVEVRGQGADRMVASGVKAYHNIRPGDWLVTSGEAGFLPAEIRIGTVVSVAKAPESPGFVSLQIKPHTDLASLRKVYIVYPLGGRLEEDPRGGRR